MTDIQTLLNEEDATGLAERVRRGEVQPIDLLEAVILRIEHVEPQLNAVAERLYESARSAALDAVKSQGVFAGVPMLIKDLFTPVNGAVMSNGSLAMGEFRATFDSEVVSRLRRAGCVIAGTTTAPEFGTSYSTESTRFGAPVTPGASSIAPVVQVAELLHLWLHGWCPSLTATTAVVR